MEKSLIKKKPLDEKEKEALQKKYKEHRQSIWFGEHSRKVKKKKDKRDVDNFVSREKEKSLQPPKILGEEKGGSSAEQPARSVEIESAISVKESKRNSSPKSTDYEEQNQIVILRRAKEKKYRNEAPTEKMPSANEHTMWFSSPLPKGGRGLLNPSSLYESESTHKTEVKLSSPDEKTIILERHEPQSKNSKETKKDLTLIVFIGIVAVIAATVLGVLLGYLIAWHSPLLNQR